MEKNSFRIGVTAKTKQVGTLDRCEAVPKLVGDPKDLLVVAGVAGSVKDTLQLCGPDSSNYAFGNAMGSAAMIGLGLALAQPEKQVLVITGDGDLLMNVGSLATISIMSPPNLSILCVDNGHYWETGGQISHTALGVDLAAMAAGAGIETVKTVTQASEFSEARSLIQAKNGPVFILLKVKPGDPPKIKRSGDAVWRKHCFRQAL